MFADFRKIKPTAAKDAVLFKSKSDPDLHCRPFHVQYEDGDSEDLTMAEVEAILV